MRHNKAGKRLGRNSSHRAAMLRNMATSLILHEKVTTTDARAKELRKVTERLITLGKRGDLHARRQAAAVLRDPKAVAKLFDQVGPRFKARPGGYTRIIKIGSRLGDNAPQSLIELVEEEFTPKPKKVAPTPRPEARPAQAAPAAAAAPVEEPAAEPPVAESAAEVPADETSAAEEEKKEG